MEEIVDESIIIDYEDLSNLKLKFNKKIGLTILWDKVKYDFILNLKQCEKLIILGSGALGFKKFDRSKPYIERHSWHFKYSAIYYHDPTYYLDNSITVGWGIGTKDNYYLEKIALILENIIEKLNILKSNIIFYGSSAGGFTSLLLSTMIKETYALADIPQLYIYNYKSKEKLLDTWKDVKNIGFKDLTNEEFITEYKNRLSFIEMMKKEKYIPNAYLILDCSVNLDYYGQYIPFFIELQKIPFNLYSNKLKLIIDGKKYGHKPLSKQETINLIYNIIEEKNSEDKIKEQFKYAKYNIENKSIDKLIKHNTARIDIQFEGTKNNLDLLEINDFLDITQPIYLNNEKGPGMSILNNHNCLNLKIQASGEGTLILRLRGIDYRHNQKRIPIYIKYTKMTINTDTIFNNEQITWHDKPYVYRKKITQNETIKIHIEWEPL